MQSMSGQVAMFRPRPGLGHDRTLHVLDRRLNGFALVGLGPVPVPPPTEVADRAVDREYTDAAPAAFAEEKARGGPDGPASC